MADMGASNVVSTFDLARSGLCTMATPLGSELLVPLHVKYIQKLSTSQDDLMYHLTSHLRLNAVYWGLTAVTIMKHPDALDRTDLLDFVMKCWDQKTGAPSIPYNETQLFPYSGSTTRL